MITAIILSAGESKRMGTPKPLLMINHETFLAHIISLIRKSKVGSIMVVLGSQAELIRKKIPLNDVELVFNDDFAQGQLSSLKVGLRAIKNTKDIEGVMVFLVDHPLISVDLINKLLDKFYGSGNRIVVPTYKGRRGHPVIFPKLLFSELMTAPNQQGARTVLRNNQAQIVELDTSEEGILLDIDTPEQYAKIKALQFRH